MRRRACRPGGGTERSSRRFGRASRITCAPRDGGGMRGLLLSDSLLAGGCCVGCIKRRFLVGVGFQGWWGASSSLRRLGNSALGDERDLRFRESCELHRYCESSWKGISSKPRIFSICRTFDFTYECNRFGGVSAYRVENTHRAVHVLCAYVPMYLICVCNSTANHSVAGTGANGEHKIYHGYFNAR